MKIMAFVLFLGGCTAGVENTAVEDSPSVPYAATQEQAEQEPASGGASSVAPQYPSTGGVPPMASSGGSSGSPSVPVMTGGQTPMSTGGQATTYTGGSGGHITTGGESSTGGTDIGTGGSEPLTCDDLYNSKPNALECCLTNGCEVEPESASPVGYILHFTSYCVEFWPSSVIDYPDTQDMWDLASKTVVMQNMAPYNRCQELQEANPDLQCANVLINGNLASCWQPEPGCILPEPPMDCHG